MVAPAKRSQYRIVLRGECGELITSALADFVVESGGGWTAFTASVRDESELYGLLDRIEDFALHVVSLNELGAVALRPGETDGCRLTFATAAQPPLSGSAAPRPVIRPSWKASSTRPPTLSSPALT